MANHFGYNQQYTDKPGMWSVDGYAVVTDGYGNLAIQINQLQTTGVITSVQQNSPSAVVKSITQTAKITKKIRNNTKTNEKRGATPKKPARTGENRGEPGRTGGRTGENRGEPGISGGRTGENRGEPGTDTRRVFHENQWPTDVV